MTDVERKLAAILSADVVGYSRLMAEDEAGTVRRLTAYRDQIATLVREHRGRVVDSPGDNVLAEFPTATDAVGCAVEIQGVLNARNAPLPEDQKMEFRIGVHLGEIRVEGERIYGDGVNIASRLEGLAPPGGICVSSTVHEQVERKLNVALEDLGERTLKNIPRPIHVYGVKVLLPEAEPESRPQAGKDDLTVPGFGGRPAIAVLPFDNLSGDFDQEYFADGIAEDLITRLSAWRRIPVIARNSSFTYKGKAVDVKQAGRELGVRYVVEGSVRKAGDRVRITAQLIDATTGAHVWAETYDRELRDIFALQDEISKAIVGSIYPQLLRSEQDRAARTTPEDLDALDLYWRAGWHYKQYSKGDNARARLLLEKAIQLDPRFAWAHALLAILHGEDFANQWSESPSHSLSQAEELARRAVALENDDPLTHDALGRASKLAGQGERAVEAFERALLLDPSYVYALYHLGATLTQAGKPDEAIERFEAAMRLSPRDPWSHAFFYGMSTAHAAAGRYEQAIRWAQRSLELDSGFFLAHLALAFSYAMLGRLDEARASTEEALQLNPGFSLAGAKAFMAGWSPSLAERTIDALRKAGLPE